MYVVIRCGGINGRYKAFHTATNIFYTPVHKSGNLFFKQERSESPDLAKPHLGESRVRIRMTSKI